MEISFCPSCLNIIPHSDIADKCKLCKEDLSKEATNSRIFRIQQQLVAQVKESEYLLRQNYDDRSRYQEKIDGLKQSIRVKQNELNKYVETRDSERNTVQDDLLVEKGRILQQIENLRKELDASNKYWSIYQSFNRTKGQIEIIEQSIKEKEERQVKNYRLAIDKINFYAKELLKGDGQYEVAFSNAQQISLDFNKNTYAVDGRNNFSASSLVILKNSIRLAVFFASITLDFMRFPRFILCDNIEDKGMNETRSKNFQRNLVAIAQREEFVGKKFQLIFTTSMIDATLNIETYTIGEFYTPQNKALKV